MLKAPLLYIRSPEDLGRKELSSGSSFWQGWTLETHYRDEHDHAQGNRSSSRHGCSVLPRDLNTSPGLYMRGEQEVRLGSPDIWSHFLLLLVTGIGEGVSPGDFINGARVIVVQGSILGNMLQNGLVLQVDKEKPRISK